MDHCPTCKGPTRTVTTDVAQYDECLRCGHKTGLDMTGTVCLLPRDGKVPRVIHHSEIADYKEMEGMTAKSTRKCDLCGSDEVWSEKYHMWVCTNKGSCYWYRPLD